MNDLVSETVAATVAHELEQKRARLLIVDDEPFVASVLELILQRHGYEVRVVESGDACLATMAEFSPEVILLDIEMPGGIDGYETCQRIRNQFDQANLTIIFLSGHDSLEERLKAYDVGGDDFVAKPFEAEEICRKIALAVSARIHRRDIVVENISLAESLDVTLQGYDDLGTALKFTRAALACRSLNSLAELMIASIRVTRSECIVQLRGSAAAGKLTLTPKGTATPLEDSVIERMKLQDRIFQFKSRMIVNYESVSVLVVNMPADNEALAGRIRDYVAIVAEAAEDAVENISLRADALERAKELGRMAETAHAGIEKIQACQHAQQGNTHSELESMVEKIESMYYQFGLSDRQEAAISDTVRLAKDEVLKLFDLFGADLNAQLATILGDLNRASTYRIDMEESLAPAAEVW